MLFFNWCIGSLLTPELRNSPAFPWVSSLFICSSQFRDGLLVTWKALSKQPGDIETQHPLTGTQLNIIQNVWEGHWNSFIVYDHVWADSGHRQMSVDQFVNMLQKDPEQHHGNRSFYKHETDVIVFFQGCVLQLSCILEAKIGTP